MQTLCDLEALDVVYQDAHLVAIHKPAGLLVHRSPIDRRETRFALQMTRDRVGQKVFALHRLDKATSGLLLFALDADTAAAMARDFAQRRVQKTYLALVRGWPQDEGQIDKALQYKADALAGPERSADAPPQEALTHYCTLARATLDRPMGRYAQQRYALLELKPSTGRKHQLRRHLSHINHPIVGDVNHGDRHHNHLFHDWRGMHRLYLAATRLGFVHPHTGQELHLQAPVQADFRSTLEALRLSAPGV